MSDETLVSSAAVPSASATPTTRLDNDDATVGQEVPIDSKVPEAADAMAKSEDNEASDAIPPPQDSTASTSGLNETTVDDSKASVSEPALAPSTPAAPTAEGNTDSSKTKPQARRKSTGVPEHKGRKLSKKASKAKITHTDAKPGDHYFIKLRGFPLWPGIICDEAMLPQTLLKTRPVTAMRADGTYRADYEDGGKNISDRSFPVMYLATNEFGWVPNADLQDLDTSTVLDGLNAAKMRKDLQQAYQLASENHNLDYYKQLLADFQEQRQIEAEEKAAAKAAKLASKNKKKSKPQAEGSADIDGDVEMADTTLGDGENVPKPKSSKKRKTEDSVETPQRSDSVKKLKLKVTPKANGDATPKSTAKKEGTVKSVKTKNKKTSPNSADVSETAKEPELSLEEAKRQKKHNNVLYYRHKLQKGLLNREQVLKEDEMEEMSGYITTLEKMEDLEVSTIRATKINKVLKAILKLEEIPRESEFKFKERSQMLLAKWNKLLEESEGPAIANGTSADTADKAATTTVGKGTEAEETTNTTVKSSETTDNAGTTNAKTENSTGASASLDADTKMSDLADQKDVKVVPTTDVSAVEEAQV